ncbi:MAG: hypothetical protein P1U61_00690 [Legionellaceae bacterium]|nr:hypothetical protein [Legionellaceae bacterium]
MLNDTRANQTSITSIIDRIHSLEGRTQQPHAITIEEDGQYSTEHPIAEAQPLEASDTTSAALTTPLPVQALTTVAVPTFAAFSSLSLPIFIILLEESLAEQNNISREQKILAPLVPYLALVSLRTWLLQNSIGHRMNGRKDADVELYNGTFQDAPSHMLIALFANVSSITNALLVAYVGLSDAHPALLWTGAITLGCLNYTTDLLTDVVDAFRKHVEYKKAQGQHIAPFFKQKWGGEFIHKHAACFSIILREVLPVLSGIIRSQVTRDTVTSMLKTTVSENAVNVINIPVGFLAYWGTAYAAQFELNQLKDNFTAAGTAFITENQLSQSSVPALRLMGKVLSGQILIDTFKQLKLSTRASVNITLIFSAIALMALLQKALNEYVSSNNPEAVRAGEEGLVMNYCVGEEEALRLAPDIAIGITCVSVSLGAISMFAKSANLHEHARFLDARRLSHRVASDASHEYEPDNDAHSSIEMEQPDTANRVQML